MLCSQVGIAGSTTTAITSSWRPGGRPATTFTSATAAVLGAMAGVTNDVPSEAA